MSALADSLRTRAITLGTAALGTYSQWYRAGTFRNPTTDQWAYNTSGPASLCASMYRATGDARYLKVCIESFDYAIDHLLNADGHFVDEPGSGSTQLEVFVFCANMAWALFVLGNHLEHERAYRWIRTIKANIENQNTSGELTWYENGNWVADKVRMLYLIKEACLAWGDIDGYTRMDAYYEQQITLLVNPVSIDARWAGFGHIIDTAGGWADKSDELSHFTETAQGPPMANGGAGTSYNGSPPFSTFDTDYSGLTLEHLSQWYVASRDYRALQYLNGLTNKYMTSINLANWQVNVTGGSRHNANGAGTYQPALAVLQLLGQRQSLGAWQTDAQILAQWDTVIASAFNQNPAGNVAIGIARSYSGVIGTVLYACEQAAATL